MTKVLGLLAVLMLVLGMAVAEGNGENSAEQGVQCVLADDTTFETPAEMLKFLRDRDKDLADHPVGFQNTADEWFDSVGDLIAKKCSAPADAN